MKQTLFLILLFSPFSGFDIGFSLPYFVLGMAGGFVRSIAKDGVDLKHGAINIIVGAIVSTWFTDLIVHRFGWSAREQIFATALSLGFLSMGCFSIWDRIEAWARRNPKFFISLFINWITNAAKNLNTGGNDTPGTDAHRPDGGGALGDGDPSGKHP